MMSLQEMEQAVEEAKATISRADSNIESMIGLIAGKLRLKYKRHNWIYTENLIKLKKQLEKFDCRTRQWKD